MPDDAQNKKSMREAIETLDQIVASSFNSQDNKKSSY